MSFISAHSFISVFTEISVVIGVKGQKEAALHTLPHPTETPAHPGTPAPLPSPATGALGHAALGRLLAVPHEPLLFGDWDRTLMIHYAIDPEVLRPHVPFPLDLHEGKAYVTLVAFTIRAMRPRHGGRLGRWLFRPIATHHFLNVRTYVRVGNETGIHFITEYMDNLLSLKLGPLCFGLPYRFARLRYDHAHEAGGINGHARRWRDPTAFIYRAKIPAGEFAPAPAGSLTEWLMERYTAFLVRRGKPLLFRVWHPPWPNLPVRVAIHDDSLLKKDLPWFSHARLVGSNYSPGVRDVWMGRPLGIPHFGSAERC